MLLKVSLFDGFFYALMVLSIFLAWFFIIFKPARRLEKRKERKSLKGQVFEVCLGDYDGRKKGFFCTFSHSRFSFKGILLIEDEKIFSPGDRVKAEVTDCEGKIYLTPLKWPKDVSPEDAILTGLNDRGNWECACNCSGYMRSGYIVTNDLSWSFKAGDHFKIWKIDRKRVTLHYHPLPEFDPSDIEDCSWILGDGD